jgi:protein involved in polysaccharide export with SLBB domain
MGQVSCPTMPLTKLHLLVMALAMTALAACGDPPPSEYPTQQVYVEDTTLGPGDIFEVRVFRQKELSGTYNVSAEGSISFPLIGTVAVAGKTPAEVESILRQRLSDGYLVDPQVSILVQEYRSKKVSVFGQVRQPGALSFVEGMSVVEAVARAGGFTDLARKNAVTVTRAVEGKEATYVVPVELIGQGKAKPFFVRPGDVVLVPRRPW